MVIAAARAYSVDPTELLQIAYLPAPDPTTRVKHGMAEPEDKATPGGLGFDEWCGQMKGLSSRSRRRVEVEKLSPQRRAWWDAQLASDPKWLSW